MIGTFLKHQTPINHNWIPTILVVIAIPSYIAMTWPVDFNAVVMAVGSALSAVGMYSSAKSNPLKPKPPTA